MVRYLEPEHVSDRPRYVTGLRYVATAVPDFAHACAFYGGVWGLERVDEDSDIAFYKSYGSSENYEIRIRRAEDKRLDLLGFAAPDADAVDRLTESLIQSNTRIVAEPAKLDGPGGGYGARFFDPEGRLIEVSSDVAPRAKRDLEPGESIPRVLSHVVINSPDVPAIKAFYETQLGFRLSDWLEDNNMCFLRCSAAHHTLAIARGPHVSLNHVSFEMRGLDEYMRGTGRLTRSGQTPLWGPGRHSAGDNTFSYFLDPNGNVVEYTTGLEQITDDASWRPRVWSTEPEEADQWGTATMQEEFFPAMFNDADPGVWTPAPF